MVQVSGFTFLSALGLWFLRAVPHPAAPRLHHERCLRTLARFRIRARRNPGAIVLAPRARSYVPCLCPWLGLPIRQPRGCALAGRGRWKTNPVGRSTPWRGHEDLL